MEKDKFMKNAESVLVLKKLVFDKIEFNRKGLKNKEKVNCEFSVEVKKNEEDLYRVQLGLKVIKKDEFDIEIILLGFFKIKDKNIDEKTKEDLLTKNAVAILMPYMRSELSLLTAQPGVDCIVLQPFNINKMISNEE